VSDYFAIQHIPTYKLLPSPKGRRGRGGTHIEFGDPGQPRLFASEHAARMAMSWWLRGKVNVTTSAYSSGPDWDEDVAEDWGIEPQPHRIASDVRVVRVELVAFPIGGETQK
jgi:hypothetical protein